MRFVSFLLIGCLLYMNAPANEKVLVAAGPAWLYKINPDLYKMPASRDISDGYYFELMEFQTNLLKNTEYIHYIKQIVNESGVQNASEVSVTFAPAFEQVVYHQVVIIRDGIVLNQLQAGQIKIVQEETEASNFEYNGLKRAFITLKDVRKGDRVEVSYSVTGFNPVFRNKYSSEFYFANSTAVCNYFRTIISPKDRKLFIQTRNNASQPVEQPEGNVMIYHWDNPPQKAWDAQTGAPSWYSNDPMVTVTEYESWKDVVNWGLTIFNHYKYALPAGLKTKIADWQRRSGGDRDVFANLAARFVQDEVRYLGLEIGPNTHQPHLPADVYTHRFGDCKDKALLLATILQADSIPAYVALISTGTRDHLATAAPSPFAFNHAIVAIERSKDVFTYVDGTISSQRGELINLYVPPYGLSLILRDGEDKLQPVDPSDLYDYSIVESLDVKFYDTSRFRVSSVYTGGAADKIRAVFAESSGKEIEDNYRKYYADLFEDIQLSGPITSVDDSLKNSLTVKEAYAIPQIWKTEKGKKCFDFTARGVNEFLPDPATATGNAPLALSYPRSVNYILKIIMPETWSFNSGELHIKNDSYRFDFVPVISGEYITLRYTLKTLKDHIPAAEVARYKADYKKMSDEISFQLYKNMNPDGGSSANETSSGSGTTHSNWPGIWALFIAAFIAWFVRRQFGRRD